MIILLLMIVAIFFIISKNITDKDLKKKIIKYLTIGLIFQLLLFVLYRMNLQHIGREVYFSDSEVYWEETKNVMNGMSSDAYNRTYIYICAIIQKTSIFTWAGWNNIFNILCVDLAIVLITVIIFKRKKDNKYHNLYFFLFFTLFNPLILFSLMRNLKDALFLLIVVIEGYLLEKSIYSDRKKIDIKLLIFLVISIPILYNIRPWGFLIPLVAIILYVYQKNNKKLGKKKIIYILLGIAISCGLVIMIPVANANLKLWLPIVFESFASRGLVNNILGVCKLFVGPGPIRSIMGNTYFMYSLLSGNIMSMIGSIMWYIQLPILIVIIKKPIKNMKEASAFSKYMFLVELIYVVIYVMQYGGSTELRFRGTLYIMTSAFLLTAFDLKLDNKKICMALLLTMILLVSNLFFI